jgi:hypothetical protein
MAPYIDKETGLITAPDGGRDNLLLYTARLTRFLALDDAEKYRPTVLKAVESLTIKPGLYRRYPTHNDENSPDNFIGAVVLFRNLGMQDKLQEMRSYVRWHFWFYNTSDSFIRFKGFKFLTKDFYAIHIGLPPLIKAACGERLNVWDVFAYKIAVKYLMKTTSGSSDTCLQDDMNSIMTDDRLVETINEFDDWIKRDRGGRKAVYSDFYGPEHPFTKEQTNYE